MKYENVAYNDYLIPTSEAYDDELEPGKEHNNDYETTCAPQFTQENDIIWGNMPIYEGNVKHYAEI